jgi:hypothetical protein
MQVGTIVSRVALSLAVAGTAVALSGCSSLREAMGGTKAPPDEFAVLTAAPLIVPPDYNLRPPQPGAPARNQADPSTQARAALYSGSSDAAAAALGPTYSESEKTLLARSGAANVDPSIRQTIAAETRYESTDPALTDRVLSGGGGAAQPAPAPAEPAPPPAASATTPATAPATAPADPPPDLATAPATGQ